MLRLLTAAALVLATACAHGPVSANRKYAAAPRIENPLLGRANPVPGMTSMPEAFIFTSFDPRQICFDDQRSTQSPAEATATQYSLRFLLTDDADLKTAPTLKGGVVQVLNSSSTLVPVRRTVKDTIRDEHGNTIATVDREVQELETHYQTQLRVCFQNPQQALTADARFMVLLREVSNRGSWGIPMGPRPAWVWRFPAADVAPAAAPVATATR
jgi:hypothetical protein